MLIVLEAPYCAQNSASILWKGLVILLLLSRYTFYIEHAVNFDGIHMGHVILSDLDSSGRSLSRDFI